MVKIGQKLTIRLIAFAEIAIGSVTVAGLGLALFGFFPVKPINVSLFVFASALVSASLGFSLLRSKEWARRLLVFFSGWVILTKILIFMGILEFKGEFLMAVPTASKNILSTAYHIAVILVLSKKDFRRREGSRAE